jgi:hypothetical protein
MTASISAVSIAPIVVIVLLCALIAGLCWQRLRKRDRR